jgi:hypothetical protein
VKRSIWTAVICCIPLVALAHEAGGHHKVMGTVQSTGEHEIVVKTTDGQQRTIGLDKDTVCKAERRDASCDAVKPGIRVVVKTRDEEHPIADEIRFSLRSKK